MSQAKPKYAVRLFTAGDSVEDALKDNRWGVVVTDGSSGASLEEAMALYKLATA